MNEETPTVGEISDTRVGGKGRDGFCRLKLSRARSSGELVGLYIWCSVAFRGE